MINRIYRISRKNPKNPGFGKENNVPSNGARSKRLPTLHPSSLIPHPSQKASSLITALLVLVVLSTIVVAFMQSMSIERTIAKSSANRLRAEMAVLSGLQLANEMITRGIGTNYGYATITTNVASGLAPVLVIASGQNHSRVMPLVSGTPSSVLPNGLSNSAQLGLYISNSSATNSSVAVDVNRKVGTSQLITGEPDSLRYNAPWVYLTDAEGKTNARFSFFVTDEQAKLNIAVHGTNPNTNRIGWSQPSDKIPLALPGNTSFLTVSPKVHDLVAMYHFGKPLIGQVFGDRDEYESKKHLYSLNSISSSDFIPAGRTFTNGSFQAFPDAHKPKFNINDLATNTTFGANATQRAINIAAIINSNLSAFKTRDVAFAADNKTSSQIRYVERLAASIVDYIDSDSVATLLADGEPAGKELAALITSVAEKYNWTEESGAGTSWTNRIVQTTYVGLWNPYQTNITGSFGFELFTPSQGGRYRYIQMPGAIQDAMLPVIGTNAVTLRPNEYKVYEMGSSTNIVVSSVQGSISTANHPRMGDTASTNIVKPLHTRYRATWDGSLMDYTPNDSQFYDSIGPGLKKDDVGGGASTRISLNGISRFSINYPQFGSFDATKGYRAVSDPRQNYLANYVWESLSQANADVRWNGRNNNTSGPTRQDYSVTWARRDAMRANPPVGVNTGNSNPTTASTVWLPAHTTNSPGYIRNAPMQTIGELGNIYDPVHLNDVGFATDAGNPDSWYASGGGRTLRIGQIEFSYPGAASPSGSESRSPSWNNDDLRSISLVDLFTAIPTNASGISSQMGNVNLNTAHRDVLATLFSGLRQNGDLAFTNSLLTTNAAFVLADTVISNRPYYKRGDFYRFMTNVLASTNFTPSLGSISTNVAAIMDPGREQVLGAIMESLDFTSRGFLVTVIGQGLDPQGKVRSQAAGQALLHVAIDRSSPSDPLTLSVHQVYVQIY